MLCRQLNGCIAVLDGFLRNQIVLEALIAFALGVVLVTLDAVRALRGLGGRRRILTFADQTRFRLVIITLVTLIVALTIAVLFRSATTGAYLIALLLAVVQTVSVILGVLTLDVVLRTPVFIRGLFRSRAQRSDDMAAHEHVNQG
jgi:hypothetical protein